MSVATPRLWLGEGTILCNDPIAPGYHWLKLHCPPVAAAVGPGQFVHLRVSDTDQPLLRRPMSIAGSDPQAGTVEILYKVVGVGTRLLADFPANSRIDLLGPVGNTFHCFPATGPVAVIGRGIGLAPLIMWALQARQQGLDTYAYVSGRTGDMFFGAETLAGAGVRVRCGGDDGSGVGSSRLLTLFAEEARALRFRYVGTCGSHRMGRLVARWAAETGQNGEIALEAQMGCAMGACRGCICTVWSDAARTQQRYALVCQEGPVFSVGQVVDLEA